MKQIHYSFILSPMFISLAFHQAAAQKIVFYQKCLFIRYYQTIDFGPNYTLRTELEDRRDEFPDRQDQWILPRIWLDRRLGKGWEAGIGFAYATQNFPQDEATGLTTAVRPELRPFEELASKTSLGKLTLSNRYRLEERYLGKIVKDLNAPGYTFNYRFRYQLQADYPLINKSTEKGRLDLRVNEEIFLNFGSYIVKNTFDQNRFFAGLGWGISKGSEIEAGYMNWYQERSTGTNYLNRNILRLTFFHNFKTGRARTS